MKDAITNLILDFQEIPFPSYTPRDLEIVFPRHMSVAIVGARHAGKSFRLYQLVDNLRKQKKVSLKNICRIQFNDHRLQKLKSKDLSLIDETFYTLFSDKQNTEQVYFLFDEIHRIEGWEDYILSLMDYPTHTVIVTGSTSKLQSGKIASALRGKCLPIEIYPFSFYEFLRHHKIKIDGTSKSQSAQKNKFIKFLSQGGFPGLLDADPKIHCQVLQSYWDTMILHDIIEAHQDDEINYLLLVQLGQALLARVGCPMTATALETNLKNAGLQFGHEVLYRYIGYFEEAYIFFPVYFHSISEAVRNRNYRKIYCIDWQLANSVVSGGLLDDTRLFENLIFIDLKRRGYKLSYYRNDKGHEIDFICIPKQKSEKKLAVQVCFDLSSDEVLEREVRALAGAVRFLKLDKAVIITAEGSTRKIVREGLTIEVCPAWKWLTT